MHVADSLRPAPSPIPAPAGAREEVRAAGQPPGRGADAPLGGLASPPVLPGTRWSVGPLSRPPWRLSATEGGRPRSRSAPSVGWRAPSFGCGGSRTETSCSRRQSRYWAGARTCMGPCRFACMRVRAHACACVRVGGGVRPPQRADSPQRRRRLADLSRPCELTTTARLALVAERDSDGAERAMHFR